MFCSQLEQLIQQLYALSEKTELRTTASVDGVKSSSAEHQVRDKRPRGRPSPHTWGLYRSELTAVPDPVSDHLHQPLTSSVLHMGHRLLNCIDATSPCVCVCVWAKHIQSAPVSVSITPPLPSSPVLRDTLLMIERTSGAVGQQEDVQGPSDLNQVSLM